MKWALILNLGFIDETIIEYYNGSFIDALKKAKRKQLDIMRVNPNGSLSNI